jgi:predicted AAA+ superfamily ATPase
VSRRPQCGRYLTLDNLSALAAARDDPHTFVGDAKGFTVIDEVQKAPALFAAIKHAVDERREPGRFLLTGSADVFMLPDAAESRSQGSAHGHNEALLRAA